MKGRKPDSYKCHFPNFTSGSKNVRILTLYNIFPICKLLFVDYHKIHDVSKFQVLLMKITEDIAFSNFTTYKSRGFRNSKPYKTARRLSRRVGEFQTHLLK